MEMRKLIDSEEDTLHKSVCDIYGAEHLARLIGMHSFLVVPNPY